MKSINSEYFRKLKRRVELRDGLHSLLRDNVKNIYCIPGALPDGSDGYGFRTGHIYKLLQLVSLKGDPDIRDEELKRELLYEMLGGYPLVKTAAYGTKFFVSTYEGWTKTLGKPLNVISDRISA